MKIRFLNPLAHQRKKSTAYWEIFSWLSHKGVSLETFTFHGDGLEWKSGGTKTTAH